MFGNRRLNYSRAWLLLVTAIIVISLACWLLVEAVYMFGDALGIGVYFVAVILAAAATSVPDTILSMKDAKAGEYDDAIANALGSNIFDITICLGLPLMLFGLIYGEAITLLPESQGPVTELRALLLIFTIIAFTIYYFGQSMGKFKAVLLFCLYLAFVGYIVASAYQVTFALEIGKFLQGIIQFII
jgi:cation:H+ antiporter